MIKSNMTVQIIIIHQWLTRTPNVTQKYILAHAIALWKWENKIEEKSNILIYDGPLLKLLDISLMYLAINIITIKRKIRQKIWYERNIFLFEQTWEKNKKKVRKL